MSSERGFASSHALILLVLATMAGAYFLKSAAKEAGTAGSYFHMRSAAAAAQAGLNAGLAQLESGAAAASILEAFRQDPSRCWLLGAAAPERARRQVDMPATSQSYSARIVAFDTATRIIKIESEGRGPGESLARVTGLYRLEGLGSLSQPPPPVRALHLAGAGRSLDAPVVVEGAAYFGGAVRIAASASGTAFGGPFKVAAAVTGGATLIRGSVDFRDDAYFETPLEVQGGSTVFHKRLGLDDDLVLNASARLQGAGSGGYANGTLSGGRRLDLGGGILEHAGFLDPARIVNAGALVNKRDPIDIAARFGLPYGEEEGPSFNPADISPEVVRSPALVGLPDAFTADDLTQVYHRHWQDGKMVGRRDMYMVFEIDHPMTLIRGPSASDNATSKALVFIVRSTLTVNGNLWRTTRISGGQLDGEEGNAMFYVPSGGSIVGLGGNDRFRGYVLVEGTGRVSYQWGPGGSLVGAVHHASPASGFQLAGPHPFRIQIDRSVLDDFATVGVRPPAPLLPPSGPALQLVDVRVRARLLGLYH